MVLTSVGHRCILGWLNLLSPLIRAGTRGPVLLQPGASAIYCEAGWPCIWCALLARSTNNHSHPSARKTKVYIHIARAWVRVLTLTPRIPPPLSNAPTDAEYAVELISQRVALGLPIHPDRRKRDKSNPFASRSRVNVNDDCESDGEDSEVPRSGLNSRKWSGRLEGAMSWTEGMKDKLRDAKVSCHYHRSNIRTHLL